MGNRPFDFTLLLAFFTSLFAGLHIDFTVRRVTTVDDFLSVIRAHFDVARAENWRGFFPDDDGRGNFSIHEEKLDLTAFGLSQRVIGSALDPANPPAWYVTGYSKSNMKVFSYAGDDVGAGFYALSSFRSTSAGHLFPRLSVCNVVGQR